MEHPLVRVVFPDLVAELTALLEDEGERELAVMLILDVVDDRIMYIEILDRPL